MNEETKQQIQKHQKIGFWKDFVVVLLLFLLYFLPVFISAVAHFPEYLWLALIAVPLFVGAILYLIWRGKKFKRMIFTQVQTCQCNLDSDSKKILWGVYLSRNWIIVSGRFAICRYNIKHSSHKEEYSRNGGSYIIRIVTRDNKTYRFRISRHDYEKMYKIKKWLKNARF